MQVESDSTDEGLREVLREYFSLERALKRKLKIIGLFLVWRFVTSGVPQQSVPVATSHAASACLIAVF